MTRKFLSSALALALASSTLGAFAAPKAMAETGGCLKYGAAGAAGGHVAHHHAVLGAMAGCAVGMYRRHKFRKEAREKAALWDKEHPDTKVNEGLFHHESTALIEQKAEWYDQEHNTQPGTLSQTSAVPSNPTVAH
ncbi:hypothetical protein E3E11_02630 [Oecophyllibacter saccharovorans]|uniref:hypothetical protein n=1 Tax=Oecophyllibacter saccharovorans TaxID=2558360 RepID=UPI001141DF30|nr:hypothetical protein E3E11_02630 [Oecophyllibacter saccharovorans]